MLLLLSWWLLTLSLVHSSVWHTLQRDKHDRSQGLVKDERESLTKKVWRLP